MDLHHDAVKGHHRFEALQFRGEAWDLTHLEPFVIRIDPDLGFEVDVVVLFSCHCFTRKLSDSDFGSDGEIFDDGRERRVLDEVRYELSRQHLRELVRTMPQRRILVAAAPSGHASNFMTFDIVQDGAEQRYAVFFEVERDRAKGRRRVLLRVQSAYLVEKLTSRQKTAKKVSFKVLLKAAFEGRTIRA